MPRADGGFAPHVSVRVTKRRRRRTHPSTAKEVARQMATDAGKVVLITGAAGNVGAATAALLRRRGARLVLVDRTLAKLERAHGGASHADAQLLIGDVDLTDEATLQAIVARTVARFDALDALVSTVGAYRAGKPLQDEALTTWDLLLALNVRTALVACRAALPAMLARGHGRIVTVASRDALGGTPGAAAYAASKAALLRMTESVAAECRGRGVTANCVLPGTIDTPQNRASLPPEAHARLVAPDALAAVIGFLLSDEARAVSGAAIPVGAA